MKDLKHLIYFENLLDSANNELVRQAKEEGQLAWASPATTCRKCFSM